MKKFSAMALSTALVVTTLAGCGSTATETTTDSATTETTVATETTTEATTDAAVADDADAVDPHDWAEYDALIDEIRTTTDYEAREAMMHQAEDMLMETGALLPIYYYNDIYMQKSNVTGIYCNAYGFKYFMFANTILN